MKLNSIGSLQLPPIQTKSITSYNSIIDNNNITTTNNNVQNNIITIAADRWNVKKKRIEYDNKVEVLYNTELMKCINFDKSTNERITKLYNDIHYKSKWSNPPLPLIHRKLIINYCKHMMTMGSKIKYPHVDELIVWHKKHVGTVYEKKSQELERLCLKLWKLIDQRDHFISTTQVKLIEDTEKINIEKDNKLRWMMEKNFSKRDEFFTIWYLAKNNKLSELEVLLNATSKADQLPDGINTRDPDFGLTPLHYSCKSTNLTTVRYLISKGADIHCRDIHAINLLLIYFLSHHHLKAPDGRTPLHFAATYGTREVVLELLGLSVDIDTVDNYGCTALQLAQQNHNSETIQVLTNWNNLIDDSIAISNDHNEYATKNNLSNNNHSKNKNSNSNIIDKLPPVHTNPKNDPHHHLVSNIAANMSLSMDDSHFPAAQWCIHTTTNSITVVPYEYQNIPIQEVAKMSPQLKLLTKRLNAYNKYRDKRLSKNESTELLRSNDLSIFSSMLRSDSVETMDNNNNICNNVIEKSHDNELPQDDDDQLVTFADRKEKVNEILVEIRLTTKHYILCVKEGLIQEAMRSLKRRWLVAKELWYILELEEDDLQGGGGGGEILQAKKETIEEEELNLGGMLDISNSQHSVLQQQSSLSVVESIFLQFTSVNSIIPKSVDAIVNDGLQGIQPIDAYSTVYIDNSNTQGENTSSVHSIGLVDSNIDDEKENINVFEETESANDEDQHSNSVTTIVDLEKIALIYERSILKPYDSIDSLYCPSEYDSLGIPVYKIADNIYWESEDFVILKNDSVDELSSPSVNKETTDKNETIDMEDSIKRKVIAGSNNANRQRKESSAIDVINKWEQISKDRVRNQPDFNIYHWIHDEVISTNSLLTDSLFQNTTFKHKYNNFNNSYSFIKDENLTLNSHSVDSFTYYSKNIQDNNWKNPYQVSFRGNYIAKLGIELANVYVARKDEGSSLSVIQDCCEIHLEIDPTAQIFLLERKCDLLLYIHDHLLKSSSPFSDRAISMIQSLRKTYGNIDTSTVQTSLLLEDSSVNTPCGKDQLSLYPTSTHVANIIGSNKNNNSVRFQDPLIINTTSFEKFHQEALEIALEECLSTIEKNIELHRQNYNSDLIEPISFVIALVQKAKTLEKLNKGDESLRNMQTAEETAIRSIGSSSSAQAINISLEILRLFVKYNLRSRKDLYFINKKSQDINRNIVEFSFTDIAMADIFTKKCAEYLSISTVAVRNMEDEQSRVLAAEIKEKLRIALDKIS